MLHGLRPTPAFLSPPQRPAQPHPPAPPGRRSHLAL
jgi:hypothetical protein